METENEIKQTQKVVEEILKTDERARNDDLWLILQVWQKSQQIKVYIPYERMREMIPAETITRCRRKIQNKHKLYLPTNPEVIRKRQTREKVFRSYSI